MTPVHFTPLVDFYSTETRSDYIEGLGYTATDERLQTLVAKWVAQGLVRIGRVNGQIAGHGSVT